MCTGMKQVAVNIFRGDSEFVTPDRKIVVGIAPACLGSKRNIREQGSLLTERFLYYDSEGDG